MQSTYGMKVEQFNPMPGWLLCEPITGQYETESGILVVRDLKKNPKYYKMTVLKVGGPFTIHGGRCCKVCELGTYCYKRERPGTYWAASGETIWMKRGYKKQDIQGKTYCFVRNETIVGIA